MRRAGIEADTAVYNTLINACANCGELEKGLETLETMRSAGIEPDVITFTSLIKACLNSNVDKQKGNKCCTHTAKLSLY
jgi:pentatricopeptide repeat domain-containing protein 1